MKQQIINAFIQAFNLPDMGSFITVMVRVLCTVIVCMIIGIERQRYFKEVSVTRAAGFRTYTMVGLGSCIFSIASIYGFHSEVPSMAGSIVDPGRVAAQVVTGVGFLGAGAIFISKGEVKGLTTAAGIWVCSALGLMFGSGLIVYGIFSACIAYLILDFPRLFPAFFNKVSTPKHEFDGSYDEEVTQKKQKSID